jgi:hypothetical protein
MLQGKNLSVDFFTLLHFQMILSYPARGFDVTNEYNGQVLPMTCAASSILLKV